MNDIADAKASLGDQLSILKRFHNWIMCILYTGTFGSFIGYSAGFPLLMKTQFPDVNVLPYAFLGPLVGALSRAAHGLGFRQVRRRARHLLDLSWHDRRGLGRALVPCHRKRSDGNFWGFFACFMALFFLTGVGNASTFQMIPSIMRQEIPRLMPKAWTQPRRSRQAERESAAIIAFTSRDCGLWRLLHPESLRHFDHHDRRHRKARSAGLPLLLRRSACLVTWFFYSRKGAPVPC